MTYIVEVTREGSNWLADVPELPGAHTFAGNIPALDEAVRDVLGLVLDVEQKDLPEYRYRFVNVDGAFARAVEVGLERDEIEDRQRSLVLETAQLATELAREGWSVRDIGGALRVSPGRVSQIVSKN